MSDEEEFIGYAWECPECGADDENGKYPASEKHLYCGVCAGDCGRDVRIVKKHKLYAGPRHSETE